MHNKNGQIISVQASAGSGKTYSLAKRYLGLLLTGSDDAGLKNIIAVTFTKKAALEMKTRVIEYLKAAALGLDTKEVFYELGFSKKELALKSASALDEILNNYDSFNISTIDSFLNRILKSCAISAEVSPNFIIEHNASNTLELALDASLKKAAYNKNLNAMFLSFMSQYVDLAKGSWFPKTDIYKEINSIFIKSSNNGKYLQHPPFNFTQKSNEIRKTLKAKASEFIKKYDGPSIHKQCLNAVRNLTLEDKKLKLSGYFNIAHTGIKYNAKANPNPEADVLWDEITSLVREYCEFYARNYYNIYCEIYSDVASEFETFAKKEEIVFISEINKKSLEFFNAGDILPEVYYRLSERYRHFLIDEFQDTNIIQWAGLKRFLDESVASGGTFFYVGDLKQAIYGFRGGEPEIFEKAVEGFSGIKVDKQVLKENYRSQKEIVNFNNKVFSKDNIDAFIEKLREKREEELAAYEGISSAYGESFQSFIEGNEKGYIEIDCVEETEDLSSEEQTRLKLLAQVKELLSRFELSDIAVLCRENNTVSLISDWLISEGYSVKSAQTMSLKNNNLIKEIISFISFIDYPPSDISFASFISGDMFLNASALNRDELRGFLFEHNKNKNKNTEALYKVFRTKYETLWNTYIEDFFDQAGVIPAYELVISILETFKIKSGNPFVVRFLELIKEFETKDSGIRKFLEFYNDLEESDSALAIQSSLGLGIQVMTVHKAKGLQFPVVILPFLELKLKDFDNPYFEESDHGISALNVKKDMSEMSVKLNEIYNGYKAKCLQEEINVLYVAFTRAEYELYAIIEKSKGNEINEFLDIGALQKFGSKEKYAIDKKKDSLPFEDDENSGYKTAAYNLAKSNISIASSATRKRGIMLHYALSQITSLKNKNLQKEIEFAADKTARRFLYEEISDIRTGLSELLAVDEIKEIFNCEENEVFNEREIVSASGETFRADKIIVNGGGVRVYDYKSSGEKEINFEQVKNYMKLLADIYPGKKISGFIVDFLGKKVLDVIGN